MHFNQAMLIGNIGKDPVYKLIKDGFASVEFSMATSRGWIDKETGEVKEATTWHLVRCAGDPDKFPVKKARTLQKGERIHVIGALDTQEWEKEGIKHWTTRIEVRAGGQIQRMDAKKGAKQNDAPDQGDLDDGISL